MQIVKIVIAFNKRIYLLIAAILFRKVQKVVCAIFLCKKGKSAAAANFLSVDKTRDSTSALNAQKQVCNLQRTNFVVKRKRSTTSFRDTVNFGVFKHFSA